MPRWRVHPINAQALPLPPAGRDRSRGPRKVTTPDPCDFRCARASGGVLSARANHCPPARSVLAPPRGNVRTFHSAGLQRCQIGSENLSEYLIVAAGGGRAHGRGTPRAPPPRTRRALPALGLAAVVSTASLHDRSVAAENGAEQFYAFASTFWNSLWRTSRAKPLVKATRWRILLNTGQAACEMSLHPTHSDAEVRDWYW